MGPEIHHCRHCNLSIYYATDDRWWHSGTLTQLRKASSLYGVPDTHQAEPPTRTPANLVTFKDSEGMPHIRYEG